MAFYILGKRLAGNESFQHILNKLLDVDMAKLEYHVGHPNKSNILSQALLHRPKIKIGYHIPP